MSEMDNLQMELEGMQRMLEKEKERSVLAMREVGLLENAMKTLTTSAATTPPVYVTSNRRLERIRDKPEKTSDPEINEWIEDVRSQYLLENWTQRDRRYLSLTI